METKKQPVSVGLHHKSGLECFRRCKKVIVDFDLQIIYVYYDEYLSTTNEYIVEVTSDKYFIIKNLKQGESVNNTNLPNYSPELVNGKITTKSNLTVLENDFLAYDNYNELEIEDFLEQIPIGAKTGYTITQINN